MSECYDPAPIDPATIDTDPIDTTAPEVDGTDEAHFYTDLNGGGLAEITQIDTDGDGLIDTVLVDVGGEFYHDIAAFDNNPGDGVFVADVVAVGFGDDGLADLVFDDLDFDGVFDTATPGDDAPLPDANPYATSAGAAPLAR